MPAKAAHGRHFVPAAKGGNGAFARLTQETLAEVTGTSGKKAKVRAPSDGASSVRSLSQCQNIMEGLTALRARFPQEFDNQFAALVEEDSDEELDPEESDESDTESGSSCARTQSGFGWISRPH